MKIGLKKYKPQLIMERIRYLNQVSVLIELNFRMNLRLTTIKRRNLVIAGARKFMSDPKIHYVLRANLKKPTKNRQNTTGIEIAETEVAGNQWCHRSKKSIKFAKYATKNLI